MKNFTVKLLVVLVLLTSDVLFAQDSQWVLNAEGEKESVVGTILERRGDHYHPGLDLA